MKNIARFTGMLSVQILFIGFLFKHMHWPYANILVLTGTFTFCFISTPIWAYSSIKSTKDLSTRFKFTLGLGLSAALLMGSSVVMSHFNVSGSSILLVLGVVVLIAGYVPAWFYGRG